MVKREGELEGLPAMIADLIEGNLSAHPERKRLIQGAVKNVRITPNDLDNDVYLKIGAGQIVVAGHSQDKQHMWISTDSATLIDLPNAKLMGGLPSIADPIGRAFTAKLLTGKMKVKGVYKVGLLSKVQRLLSVS